MSAAAADPERAGPACAAGAYSGTCRAALYAAL